MKKKTSERSTQSKHGGKHVMRSEQMQDRVCGPQFSKNTHQVQVKIHCSTVLEKFVLQAGLLEAGAAGGQAV